MNANMNLKQIISTCLLRSMFYKQQNKIPFRALGMGKYGVTLSMLLSLQLGIPRMLLDQLGPPISSPYQPCQGSFSLTESLMSSSMKSSMQ